MSSLCRMCDLVQPQLISASYRGRTCVSSPAAGTAILFSSRLRVLLGHLTHRRVESQDTNKMQSTLITSGRRCPLPSRPNRYSLQPLDNTFWRGNREDALTAERDVHSPDVWPCRGRECVCARCVRSIVLSIWNMRRSSSSKAMSPQNTAGRLKKKEIWK